MAILWYQFVRFLEYKNPFVNDLSSNPTASGPVGSTIWEVVPGLQRDGTEIFTHQELLNGLAKGQQIRTWHVLHRNHYQVTSRDVTTEVKI